FTILIHFLTHSNSKYLISTSVNILLSLTFFSVVLEQSSFKQAIYYSAKLSLNSWMRETMNFDIPNENNLIS
ncbi:hypothetical protein L9F63_010552, partial [Diploptera punctata]